MTAYTLIYNPHAGHNHGRTTANLVASALRAAGHTATLAETSRERSATLLAQTALADVVVAIGGDGTINQVAAGLLNRKRPPLLGLIPAGTVNNLTKGLGIAQLLPGAIRTLLAGHVRPLDVGRVNSAVMVSTLTLGVLANAAVAVTQRDKQKFGPLVYLAKGTNSLARHQHWQLTLHSPHHQWVRDTQFVLVTMTNSVGGFTHFAPDAAPDDGHFHVFVAPKLNWRQTLLALPYFLTGNFAKLPGMTYFTTTSLTIQAPSALQARIDGDPSVSTPLTLTMARLSVIAPSTARSGMVH
ncbi:diacylglycerol/lipid kinase family protein [Lacticaseibacillus nasuensis]|uniref:diacylglycerol/lipid kinase family protein n=1 Tax=Lacticaseibacillus nasuensis TaxID=944671 RepID=UPI0022458C73|nr:diacylglycerol kinase family protein [Lacticaseibacillus nasuensis]MCX2454988.1 diacylglycerol kinase family lipid kinase [Lacticaseibacillus nasuensis]